MAYFNYFIKCLIRRFVRLFFTKKTFIIILIFISLFFFLKSEGYCSSDILLNRSSLYLYTDVNHTKISSNVLSTTPVINVGSTYYVYQLKSGNTYKFVYDLSSSFNAYIVYDLNFNSFIQDDLSSGSTLNNPTFSTVCDLYSFGFISGNVFNLGIDYYVLIPSSVSISYLRLYLVDNSVTSNDVTNQTNTIVSSSQATQNTIKDISQQMQNTIKDSNVTVETDLPEDNTTDITESGFNSIFTIIRNTFTSSSSQDLVLVIPFTGKSFTINFSNVYGGFNSGIVGTLITLFWWYLVSVFIVKDISNKISKIKSGNIESIENTNIKEDIL